MENIFDKIGSLISNALSSPLLLLIDIADIAIIALMIYYVLKFVKETRAAQLLKGIAVIIVFLYLSKLINLSGTYFILNKVLEYGFLALLIVFQPELRSVLESVGRKGFRFSKIGKDGFLNINSKEYCIEQLSIAVSRLSKTKTGGLIVIERETKLGEIIKNGISFDSSVVAELVCNIFFNKAPLHDGAMIIRDFRIRAAGCFLPLSNRSVANDLGTRHRAAIGISEQSDAVVVVVSEETGIISIVNEGILQRGFTEETFKDYLKKNLLPTPEEKKTSAERRKKK